MQFTDTLIATIVGALTAVFTSILASVISYRSLKAEYMGKHRLEIINKQIAACESLWIILGTGSLTPGEGRVLSHQGGKYLLDMESARYFYDSMNKVFNSSSGLYFSRQLRGALFELRDFIKKEFLDTTNPEDISNTKAKYFDGMVSNLRIAIRKEIGVEDLKAGRESPIK